MLALACYAGSCTQIEMPEKREEKKKREAVKHLDTDHNVMTNFLKSQLRKPTRRTRASRLTLQLTSLARGSEGASCDKQDDVGKWKDVHVESLHIKQLG